jgi:cytochrome c oxidase subunit 2
MNGIETGPRPDGGMSTGLGVGGFELWPARAAEEAVGVDNLFLFILGVDVFFGLLVAALVVWFAVRYRRRPGAEPPRVSQSPWWIEPAFMVLLGAICLVMFGWGARRYFDVFAPAAGDLNVLVIGKQWMWKAQHPDGQREINELHVPVGTRVTLTISSEDVIHSFYVPAFRLQMNAIPGRYSRMSFHPTRPGTYHLFCTEYCGTSHSHMIGRVYVMEPAAYERWLSGGATESPATQGRKLFSSLGCAGCHRGDSQARCPNLQGIYKQPVKLVGGATVTADDEYLRESILNPAAKIVAGYENIMPPYQGQVNEEQLFSLIAYIRSLAPGTQGDDIPSSGTGINPQIKKVEDPNAGPGVPKAKPPGSPEADVRKAEPKKGVGSGE